jgi:PKD repeat protein
MITMDTSHFNYNMKKICFMLLLFFPLFAQAQQSNCANSDFSAGNFINWVGYTSVYPYNTPGTNIGTPQSPYPSPPYYYNTGMVAGRQTIITTSTPDPFTCGNVMTLPPGEKQCVRLGNGGIGSWGNGVEWQRDYLTYNFSITENNASVIYKYAVVLQDPFPYHDKSIKPRFIVSLRDFQNKLIDSSCTLNEMYADSSVIYHVCDELKADSLGGKAESPGNMIYSDWITVAVDLRKYIGKNVQVKFETWDCGLGGHFGYAYLTAKCQGMKIKVNKCTIGENVTLTAPLGFTYKWLPSGEVTQSIVINNAKYGDTAYVELTSYKGCKSFLRTSLFHNYPTADFMADSMVCAGLPLLFTDHSAGGNEHWNWDFGDGTTDTVQNPVHVYATQGIYRVRLAVKNADICTDTIIRNIYVCPRTGINDLAQMLNIHVYPNPSTGSFKLEVGSASTGNIQVEISDLLGQVVYSEKAVTKNGSLQKELDIKEQPDGIYFLTIRSLEYSKVMKLIKKN